MSSTGLLGKLVRKISRKKNTSNNEWRDEFVKIIEPRNGAPVATAVSTIKFPCQDNAMRGERTPEAIYQQFVKQKSTKVGEFGYIYSEILHGLKGENLAVLEIGQRRGETFKTLCDVLPTATIYGIDIGCGEYQSHNTKAMLEAYSPKARPFIGDQTDPALLNRVGSEALQEFGGFDLVIDDGGHSMKQQQISLKVLSNYMKPRGIYVIEDIETSYLGQYGGGSIGKPGTTIDLMKGLIDVVNRDYLDGHYKALKRPRRGCGTHSLFANDHKISSVRVFPTCAVLYFGYEENLPAEFQKTIRAAA
jgi:hypothetical protein